MFDYALFIYFGGKTIGETWLSFLTHLLIGSNYAHLYFIIVIAQFYLVPAAPSASIHEGCSPPVLAVGIISQLAFYLLNYHYLHLTKSELVIILYALLLYWRLCRASHTIDGWDLSEQAVDLLCLVSVSRRIQLSMWLQRNEPHWVAQPWLSRISVIADYSFCAVSCLALSNCRITCGLRLKWIRNFITPSAQHR